MDNDEKTQGMLTAEEILRLDSRGMWEDEAIRFARLVEAAVLAKAAPQSPSYTSEMGEAANAYHAQFRYAHPLPAQWRWSEVFEEMIQAAPHSSISTSQDVRALLDFIFDRFGAPGDAGELSINVMEAIRRLEHSFGSAMP